MGYAFSLFLISASRRLAFERWLAFLASRAISESLF